MIALAPIAAVMTAMFALLLLLAFPPLRKWVVALFQNLPVVGGFVAGVVDNVAVFVWDLLKAWFAGLTGAFDGFVAALYYPLQTLINAVIGILAQVVSKYVTLKNAVWILFLEAVAWTNNSIAALAAITAAGFANAANAMWQLFLTSVAWTNQSIAALAAFTAGAIVRAEQVAYTGLLGLAGWTTQQLQALAGYTGALITQTRNGLYADILGLAQWTTAELGQVVTWTQGLVGQATNQATAQAQQAYQGAIDNTNGAAVGTIAGAWPGVSAPAQRVLDEVAAQYPGAIPGTVTGPIAVPSDLATTLAATLAMVIPATVELDQCLIPLCRNMGDYGNWLKDLETLLAGGIALDFLLWAIQHPHEAATDASTVVRDAASPVVDVIKAVA